jgi:hypothetical protein
MGSSPLIGSRRLIADYYGAGSQRRVTSALHAEDVADVYSSDLTAWLRLDQLLAEKVVIPDTYFLDGSFFMGHTPEELIEAIGFGRHPHHLNIEVMARPQLNGDEARVGQRLADALRTLLFKGQSDQLNGFPFHYLSDVEERFHLADVLASTDASVLQRALEGASEACEVPGAIASFLKTRCESDNSKIEIEQLSRHWRLWIEAEEAGVLTVAPYGSADFNIDEQLRNRPLFPRTDLRTDFGREILAEIIARVDEGSKYRSEISKVLERERPDGSWREGALSDADLYASEETRAYCLMSKPPPRHRAPDSLPQLKPPPGVAG